VRRNAHGVVPKLPEVKPYESVSYSAYSRRDPFTPYSEPDQEPPDTGSFGEGPRPDFNRKRETLEQFPLDTLKYVGHLEKGGVRWGLVQSGPPDETVYRPELRRDRRYQRIPDQGRGTHPQRKGRLDPARGDPAPERISAQLENEHE